MQSSRIPRTKRLLKAATVSTFSILMAAFISGTASAWGPERTTYTNEHPAKYATFNSITNNAGVGDERNFVRVGELGTTEPYVDELEVVPGKEYEVYIYYHNNAASNTNSTGFGMANNVRMSSAYPTTLKPGERGMVSGIISWRYVTPENDNPTTGKVWDEAYLTTKADNVVLRYKVGSAKIHNAGATNGSNLPSSALFDENGTLLGFNKMVGSIPGCAEYSGYVTYTLVAEKPDSTLTKEVSTDGENWSKEVSAEPGEYVTYRVRFENTGNTDFTNSIFKDTHDDGLTIRSDSVKVFDAFNTEGKQISDILDISGYNTGDTIAGAMVDIIYQAQVSTDEAYCGKTLTNTISVNYNTTENKYDEAAVKVRCQTTEEEEDTEEFFPEFATEETEKNCATNPEMEGCNELPNTGPLEIILATVIIAGIGGGGYYLYRTKKTLSTVKSTVSGKHDNTDVSKTETVKQPKQPSQPDSSAKTTSSDNHHAKK